MSRYYKNKNQIYIFQNNKKKRNTKLRIAGSNTIFAHLKYQFILFLSNDWNKEVLDLTLKEVSSKMYWCRKREDKKTLKMLLLEFICIWLLKKRETN